RSTRARRSPATCGRAACRGELTGGNAVVVHPPPVHPRALEHAESVLRHPIADESELTAGVTIAPGKQYGFFTDTSLCIGFKACEVACKEWNALPADGFELTGQSYDNTGALSATTW